VSDAGTPAISDPGAHLVAAARAAHHRVIPVPGASALTAALSAAGLSAPHFLFYGFLPQRAAERRRALERLRAAPYALVFYEAPHRIETAVAELAAVLGPARRVVIARELTKLFETIHVCALGELPSWIAADHHRSKGEFVLIVEAAPEERVDADAAAARHALEALVAELPLKQAVALATRITGAKKNELYAMALRLKAATVHGKQ
jgi:16S rRNA (cytidine1402-2'-O)-methyltransferase